MIEIVFGLLLLVNGLMLVANYSGLVAIEQHFPNIFDADSFLRKSALDWRSLIEHVDAMVSYHLFAFVLICMGITILGAALHTKKSL